MLYSYAIGLFWVGVFLYIVDKLQEKKYKCRCEIWLYDGGKEAGKPEPKKWYLF